MEGARRARTQLGLQAVVGPCRDPAVSAAGVSDGDPIIDDLTLDKDLEGEDGVISTFVGETSASTPVVTKEEKGGGTPPP